MTAIVEGRNEATRRRGEMSASNMSVRIAFGLSLALMIIVLLSIGEAPAEAATPAPAWGSLQITTTPTVLTSGAVSNEGSTAPELEISLMNVGGGKTNGTFTVTAELPPGVSVATDPQNPQALEPSISYETRRYGFTQYCTVTGRVLTCSGGGMVIPSGGGTEPKNAYVRAGDVVNVIVHLDVNAAPGESLTFGARVEGGGAATISGSQEIQTGSGTTGVFGFAPAREGLFGSAVEINGSTTSAAGSHPQSYEAVAANLNQGMETLGAQFPEAPDGGLKKFRVNLPRGMVVNPQAVPQCTESELEAVLAEARENGGGCPEGSQIGTVDVTFSLGTSQQTSAIPLFNMVPPYGQAAEFGFSLLEGLYTHVRGFVRTGEDYGLSAVTAEIPAKAKVAGVKVQLWGDPTSEIHDEVRNQCSRIAGVELCSAEEALETPFVSFPSDCGNPLTTSASISSWKHPDVELTRSTRLTDNYSGEPLSTEGCNQLPFQPSAEVQPTTPVAEAPTGLDVKLHVPQIENVQSRSTANVKDVSVTLPAGMAINPASASGLTGCTSAEVELHGPNAANCPDGAKLGTAEVVTPLLKEPLAGSIYLAKPFENPFNSLIALYLTVDDPASGVVLKLPGEVKTNPVNGQVTAAFKENPELPFSDLNVSFFNGARAALTTPMSCGSHATSVDLTPWSTPEGADVNLSSSFQTTTGQAGACPTSEAGAPDTATFSAGTKSPVAGLYSPFSLRITRPEGTQHIAGIETLLPDGLLGKLAGIPYCPESGIAQAQSREVAEAGKLEQASPSCPAASEVGTVQVTAGSGIAPIPVGGHAYLAGPYRGAPLSLVIITPAVAGPFDLGNVVTRVALFVDETTAQLRAVADPLPTIRDGIPLDIRSIELKINRPGFILNPTSCESTQITGTVTSATGATTPLVNHFQVGECGRLRFKPKIGISFSGAPTRRGGHPRLRALIKAGAGEANIGRATVTLPKTEFLDNAHIRTICTRVQYATESCPQASIYGYAKAWTPLLDKPLEGPVYLRSSSNTLPDLVASLNGQIKFSLDGKITSTHGRVRNTFETVPDAPVSKFELVMRGRGKGLLVNNTELCRAKPRATASFVGHNGKVENVTPLVEVAGCGKKSSRHRHGKKGGRNGSGKHGKSRWR